MGNVFNHLGCIIVQHRIMLDDDERVVGLLRDGHELEGCEGSADLQLGEAATQPAEYARVVTTYVENLEAMQVELAVQGFDQYLHR